MASVRVLGPAQRVGQGPDPTEVAFASVGGERGPAVLVVGRALGHRRAIEKLGDVALDVIQLVDTQNALEDVEPDPLVGIENVLGYTAVVVEAEGATVPEGQ